MYLKLLGTAAGGGFPQWNCNCLNCRAVRQHQPGFVPRLQSSIAVISNAAMSSTQRDPCWVLVNASPDIRAQLEMYLPVGEGALPRSKRLSAIILTDAQLDHTAGLLLLREANSPHPVYCSGAVLADLMNGFPALRIMNFYAGFEYRPLLLQKQMNLDELEGVRVFAIPISGKAPPYSPTRGSETPDTNVALVFEDEDSGRRLVYAPGLAKIELALVPYFESADVLLLDGTAFYDDDMIRAECSSKTATSMGHLPLSGMGSIKGLIAELREFPKARKILVHINNTNPILDPHSGERRILEEAGIELGFDGMEIFI